MITKFNTYPIIVFNNNYFYFFKGEKGDLGLKGNIAPLKIDS